jgi:hypothetical protein
MKSQTKKSWMGWKRRNNLKRKLKQRTEILFKDLRNKVWEIKKNYNFDLSRMISKVCLCYTDGGHKQTNQGTRDETKEW